MKKIITITTILFLAIISGISLNAITQNEKDILENQHTQTTQGIDCHQATVTFTPIRAICDINDDCKLEYSYSITEIDYTSISRNKDLDYSHTRSYLNMKESEIGTKHHEDLLKDKKKQVEIEAKEYCKAYKERLKQEYTYEVILQ